MVSLFALLYMLHVTNSHVTISHVTISHVTELTNDRQAHGLVPTALRVYCLHSVAPTIARGQVREEDPVIGVFVGWLSNVHPRIIFLEGGREGRKEGGREREREGERKGGRV